MIDEEEAVGKDVGLIVEQGDIANACGQTVKGKVDGGSTIRKPDLLKMLQHTTAQHGHAVTGISIPLQRRQLGSGDGKTRAIKTQRGPGRLGLGQVGGILLALPGKGGLQTPTGRLHHERATPHVFGLHVEGGHVGR